MCKEAGSGRVPGQYPLLVCCSLKEQFGVVGGGGGGGAHVMRGGVLSAGLSVCVCVPIRHMRSIRGPPQTSSTPNTRHEEDMKEGGRRDREGGG